MKIAAFLLLFSVSLLCGGFTTSAKKDYNLAKKITIAEIENGQIKILVDEKSFTDALNNSMLTGNNTVSTLQVLKTEDVPGGLYYLQMAAKDSNFKIVRALYLKKDKLIMDKEREDKDYLMHSYFVSCNGSCDPVISMHNNKPHWICGEDIEGTSNCERSVTLID